MIAIVTPLFLSNDESCKNLLFNIYEDNPLSIVYQPSTVYSNIRNGMGIFAGVSESNYYLDIKNE
jgi:hypothetical protein